jgi:hypothetical protein
MTTSDWIGQKQNERAKREAWAREQRRHTFVGEAELDPHDWDWWRQEALRTRTDWLSLAGQRLRVLQWVRDGRPRRNAQAKLTKQPP